MLRALPFALVLAVATRRRQVRCGATPSDLGLVQAWVLARETGEGDDGWRIPGEILSLLYVMSPPQ